ncbi:MAG: hypothetical protein U1E15_04955 [Hyphomicrobiales bacterium]
MPSTSSGLEFATGFAAATGLLHAAGLALGLVVQRLGVNRRALQVAGPRQRLPVWACSPPRAER